MKRLVKKNLQKRWDRGSNDAKIIIIIKSMSFEKLPSYEIIDFLHIINF